MARRHPKNHRNQNRSKNKSKSLRSDESPIAADSSARGNRLPEEAKRDRSNKESRYSRDERRGSGRFDRQEKSRQHGGERRGAGWARNGTPTPSPEAIRHSLEKLLAQRLDAAAWAALAERFRERLKNSDWNSTSNPSHLASTSNVTPTAVSMPATPKPSGERVAEPGVARTAARSGERIAPPKQKDIERPSLAPSRSYKTPPVLKKEDDASRSTTHTRSEPLGKMPASSISQLNSGHAARVGQGLPDRGFARALLRQQKPAEPNIKPELSAQKDLSKKGKLETSQMVTDQGLSLDVWQADALEALLAGQNVVVDAPTSAGKTRVIEALLDARLADGLRLIYTSPVKSLSNDKYREFCEKYGKDRVGINTGDFKENLRAPIILATLETYRNSLLGVEPDMRRRVVVYDEYHYLQDESRGSAWEESLILTPKESQVILLSASVPNADEFAHWLEKLFARATKLIRVAQRPVPLADVVYTSYGWIFAPDLALKPEELALIRRTVRSDKNQRRRRDKGRFDELIDPVRVALEQNLGPVVVYAGRRADVEAIAQVLLRSVQNTLSEDALKLLHERLSNLSGWEYVPHELQRMIRRAGIAYHHSGLIPPGRVAIETLLKEGLLKVCAGTMGISLGVNFAVRSALVSDVSRPSEGGETKYTASEVMQMLGRAGRRGKDTHGFSLWMNLGRYAEQKPLGREPCRSSLKFDPTTVLGLLGQKESIAYLSEFYRKSFFMRGRDPQQVIVADHELLSAVLYKDYKIEILACEDIPSTYKKFHKGQQRSSVPCNRCPAKIPCHTSMSQTSQSTLQRIITHLTTIGALDGQVPTLMGQLARHFPQAGGLIIAQKLANGEINTNNWRQYLQLMASFCSAHFKEIPDTFADRAFLEDLNVPRDIEFYYPEELFPELYDEVGFRREESRQKVFREFNPAAASIVTAWIDDHMSWERLVEEHTTKHFSAGDCMMVLFRFATFLQSLARLEDYEPEISSQARALIPLVLRDPLDARNRMLTEETNEFESEDTLPPVVSEEEPVMDHFQSFDE